jgi:hypothetical protein
LSEELCGADTPNGPCTMPKNHAARYHRHRLYQTVLWTVKANSRILQKGQGRVELNYAIKAALESHKKITCVIERKDEVS